MKYIFIIVLLIGSLWAGDFEKGIEAYNAKNFTTAIKYWTKAGSQGDSAAQFNLGLIYSNGQGVRQNYKKAVKWYIQAANQGHSSAQIQLANMYDNGQGVKQNYKEAVKWYTLAAKQGNSSAQFNLGNMYNNGKGVKQNYKESAKWLTLSAKQGHSSAQFLLGIMYRNGEGVTRNRLKAVELLSKSAAQGEPLAKKALPHFLRDLGEDYKFGQNGQKQNFNKAREYLERSARMGLAVAYDDLGHLYYYYIKDYNKSVEWYSKLYNYSLESYTAVLIGDMYNKGGQGLKKNKIQAYQWWLKAAKKGNTSAQNKLDKLCKNSPWACK